MRERHIRRTQRAVTYGFLVILAFATAGAGVYGLWRSGAEPVATLSR